MSFIAQTWESDKPHGIIESMISRHAHQAGVTVRLDKDDRQAAADALAEHGWEMAEFILTCLAAVTANPAKVLRAVQAHRVSRPKGRPRKAASEE